MSVFKRILLICIFLLFISSTMLYASDEILHLSLRQAFQKAGRLNAQVMMSSARVEQALARLTQARSSILPHIDGVLAGNRQTRDLRSTGFLFPGSSTQIGPFNTFDARGRLSWGLFDPSALSRLQAGQKGQLLSKAELIKVKEDILVFVATLFLEAHEKNLAVDSWRILLKKEILSWRITLINYKQGTASLLDLKKAQSSLAQARLAFQEARVSARESLMDLCSALALPWETRLVLDEDKVFEDALIQYPLSEKSIGNPDLAVAQAQVQLRAAQHKTSSADFLPKVSGIADYGRSGQTPDQGSNTYSVGVQATMPIWDGGLQQGQFKETQAQLKEAQENMEDVRIKSQIKIEMARGDIKIAKQLLQSQEAKLEEAKEFLKMISVRLQSGSGSQIDLAQAQAQQALMQADYQEALNHWLLAHINFIYTQGKLGELCQNYKN